MTSHHHEASSGSYSEEQHCDGKQHREYGSGFIDFVAYCEKFWSDTAF